MVTAFPLVFLPGAAAVEFARQTYTTRQIVSQTTTFRDCTFRGCEALNEGMGGALHLGNVSLSLTITGCIFAECYASLLGGALHVVGCRSVSLVASSGSACVSSRAGGCCRIGLASSRVGSVSASDLSAVSCSSRINTFVFGGPDSTAFPARLERVNSTANTAINYGSAAYVDQQFGLSLRFAAFVANAPANCLFFGNNVRGADVTCVALVNNSCKSFESYPGLIYLTSAVVMADCIFTRNTCDFFLGTFAGGTGTVSFVNCVFDVADLGTTNSVVVATRGCTVAGGWPSGCPP
jgi:hypothetical protein